MVQNACASLTNIGTSEALIDLSQLLVYMSRYGRKTGDGGEGVQRRFDQIGGGSPSTASVDKILIITIL